MTASDIPPRRARSPSLSRQIMLQRTGTPELESSERVLGSLKVVSDDMLVSDDDEIASLDFLGDDGATDSFYDSDVSGSRTETTSRRRRRFRKDGKNDISSKDLENYTNAKIEKQCEVGKYMAAREMTPFQERMNALTVIPSTYYCIMFFLSGSWLSKSFIEDHAYGVIDSTAFDYSQCISSSWFPHLHALPPLPALAAAIGIVCHAPFSMIYHWKYAHRLPPGLARTTHWSRRMDQVMIHFCCTFMAYATSGRFDVFLVNALFNMDCMYRQWLKKVKPKRNQTRIAISIFLYTMPILNRGDLLLYSKVWILFALGGWLFSQYPIGGWSHSAFHIVMAFLPPLLITNALALPSSQTQLEVAAHCATLANDSLVS
mmetsp:Transcript_6471/g.13746  ORF Transcript_6471/g.13746 Transcript_6471/m.13746 type:complete len:374 (-) Transcript_6471:1029-2150(-)